MIYCLTIVFSITFAGCLFILYILIEKRFQNQLVEESHANLAASVAKDTILKEKKVYTRYISHEVLSYKCIDVFL